MSENDLGEKEPDVNADGPPKQKAVSLMSDEELNKRIAQLCGWECIETPMGVINFPGTLEPMQNIHGHVTPYYCHDLNAMHTAEKVMSVDQAIRFRLLLSRNSDKRNTKFVSVEAAMCHATARQRAEAFYQTMHEADSNTTPTSTSNKIQSSQHEPN